MALAFMNRLGFLLVPLMLQAGCAMGPRFAPTSGGVADGTAPSTVLIPNAVRSALTGDELLEAAKADQRSFEILRRSRLPVALPALSGSFTCEDRVGLYCVDRLTGGLARVEITEDPDVARARDLLVENLQTVSARMPGDGWVQGQLVRYLVESGNFAAASTTAANCRVEPAWWCLALSGYVFHRSGIADAAENVFRAALNAMPPEERALWLDIPPLLDQEAIDEYASLSDEDFLRFEARFWRISDPLLTRPGNEVLTEHLARQVESNLQIGAETVEGPLNDRAALESIGRYDLLLRYGAPTGWIRGMGKMGLVDVLWVDIPYDDSIEDTQFLVRGIESGEMWVLRRVWESRRNPAVGPGIGLLAPPYGVRDLIAAYDLPSQDLLPPKGALFAGIEDDAAGEWDVVREVAQTAYAIPMEGGSARWIAPLAHQLAIFPRGDSALVVAGWDLPAHGVSTSAEVNAGVALLQGDDLLDPAIVGLANRSPASSAMMVRAPAQPSLLSVEAVVPSERTMARTRTQLNLAPLAVTSIAMSDLLLLHGGEEPIDSLEEALPFARGSNRVPPGELLRVYWEMYGFNPATYPEVTMSFTLREPPSGAVGGALRWLGETVGLLNEVVPIRTEWTEESVPGPWMGRSLSFRLPDVDEGRYTLVLTATVPGREPVVAAREIEVTRSTIPTLNAGRMFRRPALTRPTRCVPETPITASAFSIADARDYLRNPLCMYSPDPSWFGHYGGTDNLAEYGYEGW